MERVRVDGARLWTHHRRFRRWIQSDVLQKGGAARLTGVEGSVGRTSSRRRPNSADPAWSW